MVTNGFLLIPNSTLKINASTAANQKNHIVHGVEVPELRFVPKKNDRFYLVDPTEPEFTCNYLATTDNSYDTKWIERGLCYEPTEAGKQAAILHAKAWLGIA